MHRSRIQYTSRPRHQVLLIDEEGLLRDGLCAMIGLEEDYSVIGAIRGGPAIGTVSLSVDPDVVIIDFGLAGLRDAEAVKAIRQRWPNIPVLALTFRAEDEVIENALRAGVNGYLLKTDNRGEFLAALRSVLAGRRYISPSILNRVVSGYVRKHDQARQRDSDGLSERERDVMRRIAQGYRTREIADQLSLSHKTIEKHRSSLMRKLGLRSATAVAAYAISHGYL